MVRDVKIKEVQLDENEIITVMRGRIKVLFNAGGSIDVYGNTSVTLHEPASDLRDGSTEAELQVGGEMSDGTIFGGISPDTNRPMFVRPVDEPAFLKWRDAMSYAARLESPEKPAGTFRIPTLPELNTLFKNRAKIGGFNETGDVDRGWYWSSTLENGCSREKSFCDGSFGWDYGEGYSALRLVRS